MYQDFDLGVIDLSILESKIHLEITFQMHGVVSDQKRTPRLEKEGVVLSSHRFSKNLIRSPYFKKTDNSL